MNNPILMSGKTPKSIYTWSLNLWLVLQKYLLNRILHGIFMGCNSMNSVAVTVVAQEGVIVFHMKKRRQFITYAIRQN